MILLVLLRNAEVHVEQEVTSRRRCLRPAAFEELAQPVGMDETVVVREAVRGQARVGSPGDPAVVVRSDAVESDLGEPCSQLVELAGTRCVGDDFPAGGDPLGGEKVTEIVLREHVQPLARQRHRTRHVATASGSVRPPPVERMEGSRVDDRQTRVAETTSELGRRNRRGHCRSGRDVRESLGPREPPLTHAASNLEVTTLFQMK